MIKPVMIFRAILTVLLVSASPCLGQGAGKVVVRAALFPGSGIPDPLELHVGAGKEGIPVSPWGGKFSPEFELPRLDVWRFGHWENERDDQGAMVRVFKERGRVKPPAGGRIWLVFFEVDPGGDGPLKVRAFGADDGAVREGGALVLNLTDGPIGMEIPGKKIMVRPSGQQLVEPDSKRGQSYPVKFYYEHEGRARPFVTTTWFHGERRKRLALVIRVSKAGAPRLLTIDDIAAKKDAGEE